MGHFCIGSYDTGSIYGEINHGFHTGNLNIKMNLLAGRIPCCTTRGVRMMVLPSVDCCSGVRITVIPGRSGVPCTTCTHQNREHTSTCENSCCDVPSSINIFFFNPVRNDKRQADSVFFHLCLHH